MGEKIIIDPEQYAGIVTRDLKASRAQGYAEGYRAGRIAALREVGCLLPLWSSGAACRARPIVRERWCRVCRLLAEAESGEDTAEVGDDR